MATFIAYRSAILTVLLELIQPGWGAQNNRRICQRGRRHPVDWRGGNFRFVSDALDLEERLANLVSDRISPRLVPEIEILP